MQAAQGGCVPASVAPVLLPRGQRGGKGGRIMPVLIWEPVDPTNLGGTDYLYTKIIPQAHPDVPDWPFLSRV